MKTPDEIKKALGCALTDDAPDCANCVYNVKAADETGPYYELHCHEAEIDALAYIQQLETTNAELLEKIKKLERERDAAVNDLRNDAHRCFHCKHHINGYCVSVAKMDGSCYEWRGVKED